MSNHVTLEPEQEALLVTLVEASRNVSPDRRQAFHVVTSFAETRAVVLHPGLPEKSVPAYMGDIDTLAQLGFVRTAVRDQGHAMFDVSPHGYAYYALIKQRHGDPGHRLTEEIHRYLDTDTFKHKYPRAYERWARAEALLWSSDAATQMTTIGHLCREAVQELATALVDVYQPQGVATDVKKTVARLKAVLNMHTNQMGETGQAFVEALVAYWGSVNDLIQRQEHGGQMEGEGLTWEDGRRLVFQTAIVMFEVDRALARLQQVRP